MTYPLKSPYNKVTTAWGKRGRSWSCNKNAAGEGVHTGADLAAPRGTPIFAPIAGQIRHRNYGAAFGSHQFAISPDAGQPFAEGEVFFAHTTTRLADGVYVKIGDKVAVVGDEGNATGPHLHFEYHPKVKNSWNCSVHADPKPIFAHGVMAAAGAPYHTKDVYRSKCGYGEPTNGDASSDTVKELQERLIRAKLTGGVAIAVTGKYDANTDTMVRLWQEQVCDDTPDTARKSYLGPNQFKVMFPGTSTYTLHDDGNPAIASPPSTTITAMGKRFQRVNKYVTARIVYEPNWDNDLIAGNGPWNPAYFLLHHTAIPSDPDKGASSRAYILSGAGYAPVRLCNWLVDRDGTLRVIAARKSYHAGLGDGYGVPLNKMNDVSAGVEIESMGKSQDLTPAQIKTVSQLATGWFEEFKVTDSKALNHKDWSSSGKTDTRYTMTWWRQQFKSWKPVTPPPIVTPPIEPPVVIPPVEPPVVIEPPVEPPVVVPPVSATLPLGIEYWFSGKPVADMVFAGNYKKLTGVPSWAPKKDGLTFGMVYLNVDGAGECRVRLVRGDLNGSGEDPTAYQTFYVQAGDNYLLTHVWFESGEAKRPLWFEVASMDDTSHTITTRYAKFVTIPWSVALPALKSLAAEATDG